MERIVLFNKLPPTFVTEAFVEQLGVISDVGESEGEDGPGLHYGIRLRTERTRHVSLLSTVDTYTHFGKAKRKKSDGQALLSEEECLMEQAQHFFLQPFVIFFYQQ
jgi:hypothetical protein